MEPIELPEANIIDPLERRQECIDKHDKKKQPPKKNYGCPKCETIELYIYSPKPFVTMAMCPNCGTSAGIHSG